MRLRSVVLMVATAVLIAFAAFNWSLLAMPVNVSIGFTGGTVRFGFVLLAVLTVFVAMLLAYVVHLQLGVLTGNRRHESELRAQRELADMAEASRFSELRAYLEKELASLTAAQQSFELRLREDLADAANSLAASIGEVDERLEREFPSVPHAPPD